MGISDVGVELLPEIMQLGLGQAVQWPDRALIRRGLPEWSGDDYVNGWDMVKLYGSANCVLLTSGGEGCGLPLLEGASCGVPGVTTDYAAGPEYVGPGLAVPWKDYVILNSMGTRYALADIDKTAEALASIMNADSKKLGRKCRTFAERYSYENVMAQHWKPFLDECELELKPRFVKGEVKTWD